MKPEQLEKALKLKDKITYATKYKWDIERSIEELRSALKDKDGKLNITLRSSRLYGVYRNSDKSLFEYILKELIKREQPRLEEHIADIKKLEKELEEL